MERKDVITMILIVLGLGLGLLLVLISNIDTDIIQDTNKEMITIN
jgi:hypothetical protein